MWEKLVIVFSDLYSRTNEKVLKINTKVFIYFISLYADCYKIKIYVK